MLSLEPRGTGRSFKSRPVLQGLVDEAIEIAGASTRGCK